MKRVAIIVMSAAITLLSCNKSESTSVDSDSNVVSFYTGDIRTRVTDTSFDLNDAITVQAYLDGVEFASAEYTYAGNSNEFVSSDPISYRSDEAVELSYQAIYPAVENFANSFTHTISTEQSVADNYETSDLLVATVDATTSLKPSLTFVHRMSLVNITMIVNRDGVTSTSDVVSSLKVNAAVEAACDIAADTYSATGSVVEITPVGSGLEYSVLVAPQTISAGGFAVATIGDSVLSMANSKATLASGYVYELEWSIDIITGTQSVEITSIIDSWSEGIWGDDEEESTTDDLLDSLVSPDGILSTTPDEVSTTLTYVEILDALGVDAPSISSGVNIESVEFDDFTLVGDKGTGSSALRIWNSSGTITIRSYSGNTLTVIAKDDNKIKSVEFDDTSITAATLGTISSGVWSSEEGVDEVTLTLGAGTNNSLTVVIE